MANRWLFKTEPSVYSFQQLQKDKKTVWDGVANNLALKNLKDIKKGDLVFIYHTGDERQAVGRLAPEDQERRAEKRQQHHVTQANQI